VGFLGDVFNAVDGAVSAVEDATEFAGDVVTGDVHGAVINAKQFLGDANDFLQGVQGLGVNLVKIPSKFADNPLVRLSDSPPIDLAQLAIDAMKATTGSGEPDDGEGFRKSAGLLEEGVDILIDAKPAGDRWDGTASQVYGVTNDIHRRHASDVQVADTNLAQIISTEAGQVARTRQNLDDTSQYLYDFGLSTSWMNLVPGGRAAKLALDATAAAAAVAKAELMVDTLVKNSVENAARVREQLQLYNDATKEPSGHGASCDPFPIEPYVPEMQHIPPGVMPARSLPGTDYTVPSPEYPPDFGPPATTYASPTPAAPAYPVPVPTAPTAPAPALSPGVASRSPAAAAPLPAAPPSAMPTSPSAARGAQTVRPVSEGAGPAKKNGQRAPIDVAADDVHPHTSAASAQR
jgi:hypothetical protein